MDASGKLGNYSVTTNAGTLTVNAAPLTVRADNLSKTYGAGNPTLTGSVVGVQNSDDITATYATTATAASPVGDYPITPGLVDASGKLGNYSVTTNAGTLTVNPAPLTVRADAQTRSYGAANPALTATLSGFVNGDTVASAVTGVPSLSTVATAGSAVGTYDIVPGLGGLSAANYSFSFVNGTLTVTPAPLTGRAEAKSRLYGAVNPPFTVSYSGFVNGQDAGVVSGPLSGSSPATTNSPVGDYAISVWGQSAPNYTIEYVDGTLTVAAAPLVVTGDNTNRAYGQANPGFTASFAGLVNGEDTNVLGGALVLTSPADTNSPVGAYPIIPSGLTSTNYAISFSNGVLTVRAYGLSVTADNQVRSYGATNPVFSGTISGLQNGDNITATYTTTATAASPVGDYPITPSLVDASGKLGNYSVTTNAGTLTVNAAPLTVRADNLSKTYGAGNPTLTGSVVGVQNGDNITATYATTATVTSPVGTYPITPGLVDASGKLGNYSVTTNAGTLTVNAAPLTVTADGQTRSYGAANPALTATLSGFVNGDTVASAVTGVPSLSTVATAGSAVGTYDIVPGLGSLSAANYSFSFVNGTLTVTPAPLTGRAEAKSRLYGAVNPPFTVSYSGFVNGQDAGVVSGLLSGSSPATTNSPVGDYAISVWGQSAPNYTIQYVEGILTVTPAGLRVTANNKSKTYGAANPAFTTSYSGFVNGDTASVLSGSPSLTTAATVSSPVGMYAITAAAGTLAATNYSFSFVNGTLTITPASSANALASSQNPAPQGSNVVFTASVTPVLPATNKPTGEVQFLTNGVALGSPVTLVAGVASICTASLPPGSNTVTAAYAGDGNFYGRTNSLVQMVSVIPQTPSAVGLAANSDGTVTVTFQGAPGVQYLIQAATDVGQSAGWENVSTNTAGLDGRWTFTESAAAHARRFYRAAKP